MNIWDLLIVLAVGAALLGALRLIRKRKGGCGCGCSGCASSASCGWRKKEGSGKS